MDWLHCNRCFRREGQAFAVSSCGHITCESCVTPKQCNTCGASCSYLPISDQMKPGEQLYFKDPVKLIQSRLEHISQIAVFQKRQKERVTAYFRHKSMELERRLKEVMEQSCREVSELKRANAELKKPLSQRRASSGHFQTNRSNRMSLPVAITPPVTPSVRIGSVSRSNSGESLEMYRDVRLGHVSTPGLATPVSSLRDPGQGTPTNSIVTPQRSNHLTPNFFRFQYGSGSTLPSPIQWRSSQYSAAPRTQN